LAVADSALRQCSTKKEQRMQKKLLTIAVAGALAAPGVAMAQAEVYGFVWMSVNKFKYSDGTGGVPSKSMWDVASHASNFGVRGRENIGAGLTAWFQIEANIPMERSNNVAHTTSFSTRNSALGLQGNFGNFYVGQWTTPWTDLDGLWSVGSVGGWTPHAAIIGRRETTGAAPNWNCAGAGAGFGGLTLAQTGGAVNTAICDSAEGSAGVGHPFFRRISNSIFYNTPVFGGAQLKVAYQTNQDKATTGVIQDPSMWSGSVTWSGMGGKARIGAAYDAHKDFTTIGQTDKGWSVKGGFNFGFVDVGLAYENMEYKTTTGDCEATQYGVALAIPVGQGHIRTAYAKADDIKGAYVDLAPATPVAGSTTGAPVACGGATAAVGGAATAADNGAQFWSLGYDYRFSKRTTIGAGYAIIKNDPAAVLTWSGAPTSQGGQSLNPPAGSDPSTFFVSMIHRF
jgi:predicted porin